MSDHRNDPSAEEMRAYLARFEVAERAMLKERQARMLDREHLSRDFLRAVALTRRAIREGASRPSDMEEHLAWSRVQDAMLAKQS